MELENRFEGYAIIELFGHSKIAGMCREQPIAGTNMLRVDVPAMGKQPAFTRIFGGAAIYAINPCDEATAERAARNIMSCPVYVWDVKTMIDDAKRAALNQPAPEHAPQPEFEEDEPEESYNDDLPI